MFEKQKKDQGWLSEPRKVRQTRLEEDLVLPFEDLSSPTEEREHVGNYMGM